MVSRRNRERNRRKLSRGESDRQIRLARILVLAQATFGDTPSALQWMRGPKVRFAGKTPLQMMRTQAGSRLVEEMLLQIDEGMFA